jgi:hypothetical protein
VDLEREMRRILLAMLFVSEGTTGKVGASHGKCESRPPAGSSWCLVEFWKTRWEACEDEREQAQCVEDATEALKLAQRGPDERPPGESAEELAERIVDDGEGLSVAEAANQFRCLERTVRQARTRAENPKREVQFGRPYVVPETVDREERVVYLLERHVSVRAVAAQVGMHAKQVQRIKARRAA